MPRLRSIARKLGLGRLYMALLSIYRVGFLQTLRVQFARQKYLYRLDQLKPISAAAGQIELHMLLHHQKCYEGIWALYAFTHFFKQPIHIVVHSDGSLIPADVHHIQKVFPGCQIIQREEADARVLATLEAAGLPRCAALRRDFVLSLKLFDPFIFSEAEQIILLDSDILFYAPPHELLEGEGNYFSVDNGYRHMLAPAELQQLIDQECIPRLNSGLLKVQRQSINFQRIEGYLQHPGLLNSGRAASHYTEQTIFALELSLANAQPLPETYGICSPEPEKFISGHYCGGGYWASLFYTRGLPYVAARLQDKVV